MYEVVQSAQLLAVFLVVFLFRLWREERFFILLGALLFVTPVPVFGLTGGVGGFLYFSDFLGVLCFVELVRARFSAVGSLRSIVQLRVMVFVLCIVLPLISVVLAYINGVSGDFRYVILGLVRGSLYLSVFWYCSSRLRITPEDLALSLRCQLCLMAIYCGLGVGQYFFGYSVDYWNDVRALEGVMTEEGYGGGFMGLYRGAVGAWVALLLSVSSFAFFFNRGCRAVAVLPYIMVTGVCLAGALIVGSRQGVVFGLLGSSLGALAVGWKSSSSQTRRGVLFGSVGSVLFILMTISFAAAAFAETDLMEWFGSRFGLFFGEGEVVSEVASRDPRFLAVLEKITSFPMAYIFGVSEVAMVPEVGGALYELVYVDSELLWTLQKIGVVGLVFYAVFFFKFAAAFLFVSNRLGAALRCFDCAVMVGVPVLMICGFLVYGHYSLLHVQSSHAPVAYCSWLILGVAASFLRRKEV